MIIYFADRKLNILGTASTNLPDGLTIHDDLKTEDTDSGVSSFECKIPFTKDTREKVESCASAGNYILRSNGNEREFYTIIESECDTDRQEVYVYAEDAGLDLINEVVGEYVADKAYSIDHYINKFSFDSGFIIGINEAAGLTRKLSWDGETTATERLASVATQFGSFEISYSFDIEGLVIKNKYINIHKKRGHNFGVQLRINKEVDKIITTKSIANLATALRCTGGTPDNAEKPITLSGYKYDDGDFYVSGDLLKSRKALKQWSRYIWKDEPNQAAAEGHIVKTYSYETLSQQTLCTHAVTELKKICEMEVNYEIEVKELPDNVHIGDRVNIVDDAGGLYLETRILVLKTSVVNHTYELTLGENLIKTSGISQKVADLATKFAENAHTAERALKLANAANTLAGEAQTAADAAAESASNAQQAANAAQSTADTATQSAAVAQDAANAAQSAVDIVEKDVESLETSVANAQAAADQAAQAAQTADAKAVEAKEAATKAGQDALTAKTAADNAQSTADSAVSKAGTAQGTADLAKQNAEAAATTAAAAKLDAENAQKDIDSLGNQLTTVENTMKADYARKSDLTEATASLQTQISQNAAEISSTATKLQTVDETANNAAETAATAQSQASEAQKQADQATKDALAAQTAADNAAAAATAAQTEADKANTAAAAAKSVADKANTDLLAAQEDLATVQSRVDATEEDIATAQSAVDAAQKAADKANADAAAAATAAANAQSTANTAVSDAATAQAKANEAATAASTAQAAADKAQGDATAAQTKANEASTAAANAQKTADTAKANALAAQTTADTAAADAAAAQSAADAAAAKAATAQSDLDTAKQNLADVTSRVGATEEEVEAAKANVAAAQAAADAAAADAAAAQSTADTAKANAATAQTAANNAKTAADKAQADATSAKAAADAAQAYVDALAVRTTAAETKIQQNAEKIELMATKTEVAETLGGYYTKEQTDASIKLESDSIKQTVSSTYATKTALSETDTKAANAATAAANAQNDIDNLEIGGTQLLIDTNLGTFTKLAGPDDRYLSDSSVGITGEFFELTDAPVSGLKYGYRYTMDGSGAGKKTSRSLTFYKGTTGPVLQNGETYTLSGYYRISGADSVHMRGEYGSNPYKTNYDIVLNSETWTRLSWTFVADSTYFASNGTCRIYTISPSNEVACTVESCGFKLEKGNKATDWTPAPEDVEQNVVDTAETIYQTIDEQSTTITSNCESIIMSALESYVETGNYDEFKSTVETQLQILSDEITLKFTETTEKTETIDDELQETKTTLSKFFEFTENGLVIKSGGNEMQLQLDNDIISFLKNGVQFGWWDGIDFHTGNIVVDLNERAQFGNFAFIPRSDGSLSFLKVGD